MSELRLPAAGEPLAAGNALERSPQPATADDRRAAEEARELAEADRLVSAGLAAGLELALASYEKALSVARERGDASRQATLLDRIGRACRRASRFDCAVTAFSRSLSLWQELGQTTEEGLASYHLGRVHFDAGETGKALAPYDRALERFRAAGNRRLEGVALNARGGLYDRLGLNLEAQRDYEQALQVARDLGRRDDEAAALNSLGAHADRLGRFREALRRYARALELHRALGDRRRQGAALNNLGYLLWELGANEGARELLGQALSLLREDGDPFIEGQVLVNLSVVAKDLGRLDEAAARIGEALALTRRIRDRPGEAQALLTEGYLWLARAEPRKARESLSRALELVRELEDRGSEPKVLLGLGQAQAALRDLAAARRSWDEGLARARAVGDVQIRVLTLQEMARGERSRGQLDPARRLLEEALAEIESLRAEVAGASLRATHFAARQEAYEMYVDVLMQLHRARPGQGFDALAFEASERARARGLLDFLLDGPVEVPVRDGELEARERSLKQRLNAKAGQLAALDADPGLQREIEALLVDYRVLEAQLRAGSPRHDSFRAPVVGVFKLQQHYLDDDTILLEYALGQSRSYLWVVSRTAIDSFELPGREAIEALAGRVHESLRAPPSQAADPKKEALAALCRKVLAPASHRLTRRRLAVVADGALLSVPWAALPLPGSGGPLLERYELVSLPSAAVLAQLRQASRDRPPPRGDLVVLADPVFQANDSRLPAGAAAAPADAGLAREDLERWLHRGGAPAAYGPLPWSGHEAKAIAAAAGGREIRVALGFEASRQLAMAPELGRYRILHFATHGLVDVDHPELSGLLFSRLDERGQAQEGFLRLHDVYALRLEADLVVLSGCQTALGRRVRGEGIVGLVHGFFHAGASQVIASLWPVRDRATAELMQRFYRALFHDGLRPAAALRAAQLSLRRERPWRDPYFWAAFTVQGDWQAGVSATKAYSDR